MYKEQYKLYNKKNDYFAILDVERYKNGNIKQWELWSIYQNKKGMFLAGSTTSVLVLIDLFKDFKFIF